MRAPSASGSRRTSAPTTSRRVAPPPTRWRDSYRAARISGFRSGARGRFRFVAEAAADFDRRKATLAAEDLLSANGPIAGIFAANDLMALGVAAAAKADGKRGKVALIGVDGIERALSAIRSGAISGTVAQYPYTIGQLGVQACLAALAGKRIPARIDAPIQVIERSNVKRAQARFPKPLEGFDNPLDAAAGG